LKITWTKALKTKKYIGGKPIELRSISREKSRKVSPLINAERSSNKTLIPNQPFAIKLSLRNCFLSKLSGQVGQCNAIVDGMKMTLARVSTLDCRGFFYFSNN
jgi:hypothetical protein